MKYIILFLLSFNLLAKTEIIFPLGKKKTEEFLSKVSHLSPKEISFDVKKAKVGEENSEGSSIFSSGGSEMMVYDVDANNDGQNEYVIIFIQGGSLRTSGVAEVFTKNLKKIELSKIISKGLWNDKSGDLSKFHLWLAAPAIIKRDKLIYLRYYDQQPTSKFFEYLWIKNQFKLAKTTNENTY